ncbi:MAG: excinuclease ABC subunit UvrC [Gammaproteobacteria bacterium]|nr:excinuclease ABC subunit UvrC [Gammaproteobacteria bacterium]MDP6616539.1 excinuclease ABC subunit UvrC [Gammaproteobacteria bacterium]MDP6694212.1 excinuclease ABC subunit UvrC [Gammaproteobacteria bacterium]
MNDKSAFDQKSFLQTLTHKPGVYRMLDAEGAVIYVGKARDLKKRVSSYFGSKAHHPKTMALMAQTHDVQITVTGSEKEALLLELNLIKEHQPYFNVLLRDGKGYPYIHVSTDREFPAFEFHRGARNTGGRFLGPYPNAAAVRQILTHVQKLFRVRPCDETFFANRTRPCLQNQIKRCTAPCVGLIEANDYARDVKHAILFLEGKDESVVKDLAQRMDRAAEVKQYEQAAQLRDQIAAIKSLQSRQSITDEKHIDTDALAVFGQGGSWAVVAVMIRGGRVLGSRSFFPHSNAEHGADEVMRAFISQHYFSGPVPREILVNALPGDAAVLEETLARGNTKVSIRANVRGSRRGWIEMAEANAREALLMKLAGRATIDKQLQALADALQLGTTPGRIECFDISHTGGDQTVASCVVFGGEGPVKADYRRFNIKDVEAGDDYGAIAQAIRRRYTRVRNGEAPVPDLILVDGGKGQLSAAAKELDELEFDGPVLAAVAKGPERRPGKEIIHVHGASRALSLAGDSPALHVIQQIRDEAHRFAITAHRQRRGKSRQQSPLEGIPGIGPKKRRELLRFFGGLQGVRRAGVSDLKKVPGISPGLAEKIYGRFHDR